MSPLHSKKPTRLVLSLALPGLLACNFPACAEEGDAFHFGGGLTYLSDSNIFRTDPDAPGGQRSDNLTNFYGIIGFDKTIGRQELYGNFIFGKTKFSRFSELDYDNQDLKAGWNGNFPAGIHSKLEWARDQHLSNFADLVVPRRNVITADKLSLDLDVPVVNNWHAVGGADLVKTKNSNELDRSNNREGEGLEAGVRYVTPYGNKLDLVYRTSKSQFPDRSVASVTDTGYRDQAGDLRVAWQITGNNRIEGHAGYITRKNDTLTYRDFSGPSFHLSDTWDVTAATTIVSTIYRQIGAAGDNEFDYAVTKGVHIEPVWSVTEKIKLNGRIEWSDRRYLGNLFSEISGLPVSDPDRNDKTWTGKIGVAYFPTRWLQLSADYSAQQRDSNRPLRSYTDQTGTVTLQLWF